ncbi:MAG: 50S ribosomal protein L29 [Pseudomonadota bacterium]|nr:MAG: 50S ribosomal protein L29 [Pseudomonadota bacterium]
MKAQELRALSKEELQKRLAELRANLFDLRMKLRTGRLDSTADIGKTRKEIARTLTVLREKELGIR